MIAHHRKRQNSSTSFILAAIAIVLVSTGLATHFLPRTAEFLGPHPQRLMWLLILNLSVLLGLSLLILRRFFMVWSALREGTAGSHLQTKVLTVFSLVTILPTIAVSVFSAVFFHYGIKSWFDERVSTAISESVAVAEAYLAEHKDTIRADAVAMAGDMRRDLFEYASNPAALNRFVNAQTLIRSLSEVVVLQGKHVITRSRLSFSYIFEELPDEMLARARGGEVVIFDEDDRITALVLVDEDTNTYLLVSRLIDPRVINHMEQSHGAAKEYRKLKTNISGLQVQFSIVYVLMALLLLLAVIWYGMSFAMKLVIPLTQMVKATERVRAGDYSVQMTPGSENNEINILIRRFNKMTEQLQQGRLELTQANRMLDQRRRLTEAVLEGVSAGIISLDAEQSITVINRTALQILGTDKKDSTVGRSLADMLPAIKDLLDQAAKEPRAMHQGTLTVSQENKTLTLHVRISTEMLEHYIEGYIVTFDDITPLVQAQRRAAWADVARRVAHEIKNPLTPIQLSAERLRKKYTPEEEAERESFDKYLDTIIRHTADIGKMVEEFVSFARMPAPKFNRHLVKPLVEKAIFSAQTAHPAITFRANVEDASLEWVFDEAQIQQVFTNTLKNAAEAMERRGANAPRGEIEIHAYKVGDALTIEVLDNGPGFPVDLIDKLTEPYVTTRAKGTGLGLAITKKIIEDHKGILTLSNRDGGGAEVKFHFATKVEISDKTI
ncbi:MAG: PAS domain-containing sensor histidine kinase [Rickettsiales bacterium]